LGRIKAREGVGTNGVWQHEQSGVGVQSWGFALSISFQKKNTYSETVTVSRIGVRRCPVVRENLPVGFLAIARKKRKGRFDCPYFFAKKPGDCRFVAT
jgi:hypothetical protein